MEHPTTVPQMDVVQARIAPTKYTLIIAALILSIITHLSAFLLFQNNTTLLQQPMKPSLVSLKLQFNRDTNSNQGQKHVATGERHDITPNLQQKVNALGEPIVETATPEMTSAPEKAIPQEHAANQPQLNMQKLLEESARYINSDAFRKIQKDYSDVPANNQSINAKEISSSSSGSVKQIPMADGSVVMQWSNVPWCIGIKEDPQQHDTQGKMNTYIMPCPH